MRASEPDPTQIWLGVGEDLSFIEKVIARSNFSKQTAAQLDQRIKHIHDRCEDESLYLAVIGEWNSGKSTFINALLRQELLTASRVPTTAVATRLCYGRTLDVRVHFKKQKTALTYRKDKEELWRRLKPLAGDHNGNGKGVKHLLSLLTADDRVASGIDNVVINHPATFLKEGIVIIDTPGTNVQNAQHAAITRSVVEQSADAAIIIIPTLNQAGLSFIEFFGELLRPFLHRCLFLVTQMDTIAEDEQEVVINSVRRRLIEHLDVERPAIYPASPKVVVDSSSKKKLRPDLSVWLDRFAELENSLWGRLRRERVLSISESVFRLQEKLFTQIDQQLRDQQSSYQQRQEEIKRDTIQDLSSFTSERQTSGGKALSAALVRALASASSQVGHRRTKTSERVRSALFGATTEEGIDDVVKNQVQRILEAESNLLKGEGRDLLSSLKQAATNIQKDFNKQFAVSFERLERLCGKASSKATASPMSDIYISSSSISVSAEQYITERDEKHGGTIFKSMATAATAGLLVGGPVGAVVFGVGGLLAGAFWGGRALDRQKNELWDKLSSSIVNYFDEMEKQVTATLNGFHSELAKQLANHIDTYIVQYKLTYDELMAAQGQEKEKLKELQRMTQADLTEIDRRLKSLRQKQKRMAQIAV